MPYGDVEKIAKMIPPPIRGRNVSISQALETVPELKAAVKRSEGQGPRRSGFEARRLFASHIGSRGRRRHLVLNRFTNLFRSRFPSKNELTSQYPMNDLEKVGMLKMDFLGLTTLTVISDCLASIKEKLASRSIGQRYRRTTKRRWQLFGEGRTEAIFQFESSGMQDMCRRLRPKELEDLSALNALYRPGPLDGGMIDDFIDRHRGDKAGRVYRSADGGHSRATRSACSFTRNRSCSLPQKLAGYSLGEADLMRRAMGKKKTRGNGDARGEVHRRCGRKRHQERDGRQRSLI